MVDCLSRGLLCDYEPLYGPSFEAVEGDHVGGHSGEVQGPGEAVGEEHGLGGLQGQAQPAGQVQCGWLYCHPEKL